MLTSRLQSEVSEAVRMNYCIYLHSLFFESFPTFPDSPSILNKLYNSSYFYIIFPPEGLLAGNTSEIFSKSFFFFFFFFFFLSIIGPVFQEEKLLNLSYTSVFTKGTEVLEGRSYTPGCNNWVF